MKSELLDVNSELPIITGMNKKKQYKNAERFKGAMMLTGFIFVFFYSRMGILNRILTALSKIIIFMNDLTSILKLFDLLQQSALLP